MRNVSKALVFAGILSGMVSSASSSVFADNVIIVRPDSNRRQYGHRNRKSENDSVIVPSGESVIVPENAIGSKSTFPTNFNAKRESLVHRVYSGADLVSALTIGEKCPDGSLRIELVGDVTLSADVNLPSGTILNLNGHTIEVTPDATITVGTKTLTGRTPYKVWREGKDVWRSKDVYSYGPRGERRTTTEYYKEHLPGHYDTEFKDEFSYDDKVTVKIMNGRIIGQKCPKGKSAESAYWYSETHGGVGNTKRSVIDVLSGNLIIRNLYLTGHEGGNGGDATYSALWHVPFIGGGDGGNGGTGGIGSDVFFVEKGHGKVLNEGGSVFEPGRGGAGGKGSGPNPGYWLWSGSFGKDGDRGKSGTAINDSGSLMR